MNKFDFIWYEIHKKFIWTPYQAYMNFSLISYE